MSGLLVPGPCLTTATWRCCKNFSQWECSLYWKLRCHWLEFLRQRPIAVVRQVPDFEECLSQKLYFLQALCTIFGQQDLEKIRWGNLIGSELPLLISCCKAFLIGWGLWLIWPCGLGKSCYVVGTMGLCSEINHDLLISKNNFQRSEINFLIPGNNMNFSYQKNIMNFWHQKIDFLIYNGVIFWYKKISLV